jgi:hypothetical protein
MLAVSFSDSALAFLCGIGILVKTRYGDRVYDPFLATVQGITLLFAEDWKKSG